MIRKDSKNYKWVMMVLICFGILVPNFAQFMLTAIGTQWLNISGITDDSAFAKIMTAPLLPGVFLSFVAGVLVDRFGMKKLMVIALCVTTAATIFRLRVNAFIPMYVCMLLIGITATFFNANQMKLVGRWFPSSEVKIGLGIYIAMSNLSMAIGSGIGSLFSKPESAFLASAILSGCVLLLWVVFGKERSKFVVSDENAVNPPVLECLKVVLRSKKVWVLAAAIMFFQSSSLSISMFLTEALAESGREVGAFATYLPLAFAIAAAASSVLLPKYFERIPKLKLAYAIVGVLSAAGIAFSWRVPNMPVATILIIILGAITLGIQPVLSSLPLKFPEIGQRYAGTAGGVIATLMLAGNVIIPTYIILPIVKTYSNLFYVEGALMLVFVILIPLLPLKKEYFSREQTDQSV